MRDSKCPNGKEPRSDEGDVVVRDGMHRQLEVEVIVLNISAVNPLYQPVYKVKSVQIVYEECFTSFAV